MNRRFLALAALFVILAAPAAAQVTYPVNCNAAGTICLQAQPVVNPDGSNVGAAVGGATAANQVSANTKLDQLHTDMIAPTPAGTNLIGNTIKSQVIVSTTTPLTGNATYTSTTFDLGDVSQPIGFSAMSCGARSDVASATTGFQIFQSTDNTNWQYITGASVSAATFPATAVSTINATIFARYLRVVYINGASPQTIFYLFCRIS